MVTRKTNDIQEIARKLGSFWNLLTNEQQALVKSQYTIRSYRRNELIYGEGETPDHMSCILSGKVKIYRDGIGGRAQIIRVLRPAQYFGYRASMAHEPYVTAAAAFEESVICSIPMSTISSILDCNIRLAQFFISELATDLGVADKRTVSLTQKHVRGRLAESLLYLKEVYGVSSQEKCLNIRITREDLASLSNMTTANAIRTLSSFANEGLLTIDGKQIILKDEKRLLEISSLG